MPFLASQTSPSTDNLAYWQSPSIPHVSEPLWESSSYGSDNPTHSQAAAPCSALSRSNYPMQAGYAGVVEFRKSWSPKTVIAASKSSAYAWTSPTMLCTTDSPTCLTASSTRSAPQRSSPGPRCGTVARCRESSMPKANPAVARMNRRGASSVKKAQPTTRTFAQLSLDQIIGVISPQNATRAYGFKSRL